MISPILPSHDADTIALDFGVFVAKRAQRYRTSQAAIIAALMPVIAPSQPGDASRSHAPAADTPDLPAGVKVDGEVVPSASPSAEPIPEAPKPLPAASVVPDDARPAEAKTSAEDALSSASGGVQGGLPAHPATPSPETADDILGGLPVAAAEANAEETGRGVSHTSAAEQGTPLASGVTGGESAAPPPKRAPSPSERFYIRDALARYVHQSLEPSPTSEGPMMTANRVYAWFGTKKQFTAAAKRWPELSGMRRVRPQS